MNKQNNISNKGINYMENHMAPNRQYVFCLMSIKHLQKN